MLKLTREMILNGTSSAGGWNRPQLALLGVPWPPQRGWLKARIGSQIDEQTYLKFMAIKGAKKRKNRDTETPDMFGAELSGTWQEPLPLTVTMRDQRFSVDRPKTHHGVHQHASDRSSARPAQLSRDQAARDYANSAWESDAANFDAVPERAVNTGKDWQEL